ncbi:DUF1345 domain-containing protein [Lichenihabitans sp. PAMC28606]|uniref:DUF1345 domain-containing protein n=1 Tax=Lichenihabitans sp. PAMC28606 TaxID=2880932 RepID=UPI001D0A0E74|nr:DUF1345 domain-containing protein [Lichenihabitans sp. PAMC28606]UDL96482.1 DUF1345 domain-containing protein [Lichenihabitans sp. PAMC28606]
MKTTRKFYRPRPLLRRWLGPFAWRPRLTSGIVAGLATFLALTLLAPGLQASSAAVVSWDVTCVWFVVLIMLNWRKQQGEDIQAYVAEQDEGKGLILGVVLIAAAASLAAVGIELSLAKNAAGLEKGLRIGAAIATVALSWFTVQVVFALHYAHEYYAPDESTPQEDDVIGGLKFPGDQDPDYWDFLHFAVVIGVACQTADIEFTSKPLRRIGTVHGLIAFTFNTVVLALTINLTASLF